MSPAQQVRQRPQPRQLSNRIRSYPRRGSPILLRGRFVLQRHEPGVFRFLDNASRHARLRSPALRPTGTGAKGKGWVRVFMTVILGDSPEPDRSFSIGPPPCICRSTEDESVQCYHGRSRWRWVRYPLRGVPPAHLGHAVEEAFLGLVGTR